LKTKLLFITLGVFILNSCNKPKEFEYRDIKNIKINTIGFNQSKLTFDLVYYNPNNFGLNLYKANSDLYIDDLYFGKFQLDTLMRINKATEFILPLSIDVDMKNLLKNSVKLMFNQEVTIRAKGTVKIGKSGISTYIPFNYTTKKSLAIF